MTTLETSTAGFHMISSNLSYAIMTSNSNNSSIVSTDDATISSTFEDVKSNTTPFSQMKAPEDCLVIPFSLSSPWANPEDLISQSTQQTFNMFVNVIMLTVLCLISTPTNILNMIVFFKQGLKERINLCLFFLALSDFLIVFMHFEWNLDNLIAKLTGTPPKLDIMKFNVNNSIHTMAGFIYVSAFLSTLIALERCLCVVSPLRAQTMFSTKTSAIIILVGHAIILGGHHIIAARWYVVCMFDPFIGVKIDAFFSSEFYVQNTALVNFFDGILFGILIPGLCLTGVTISTVITVVKLKEMSAWREQTSSATTTTSRDVALTRMLIGISVLFIVCTLPGFIFHTALPIVPDLSLSGLYYNTYFFFINVQQLFIYINSSVNFFVYYFYGTKYRNTVRSIFCMSRARKSKDSMAAQLSTVMTSSVSVSNVDEKY